MIPCKKNFYVFIFACCLAGCVTPKPVVTVFELIPRAPAQLPPGREFAVRGVAPGSPTGFELFPNAPIQPPPSQGCAVRSVVPGSPAGKAGIKAGDIVTRLDRDIVPSWDATFDALLSSRTTPFRVELTRQGKPLQLDVMPTAVLDPFGVTCDFGDVEVSQGEAVVAIRGTIEVVARAEVIGPASFVWVRLQNRSSQPLKVSPAMFSASSADLDDLKSHPLR